MQAEQAQLSYKKVEDRGGRAAVQQEVQTQTHGDPGTATPLHWDLEPQRERKVSTEDKGSVGEKQFENGRHWQMERDVKVKVGKAVWRNGEWR